MYEQGDASARAGRFARSLGFKLQGEPGFAIPALPADITAMSDPDLMVLLTEIVSWMEYAEVYLVAAQIDEKQEQLKLEHMEAINAIKNKAAKTVTVAKAAIYEDEDYVKQKNEVFVIYSKRKMLEVVFNSLDRKRFLVSRELTRRKYGND